jgi:hypothetical protein
MRSIRRLGQSKDPGPARVAFGFFGLMIGIPLVVWLADRETDKTIGRRR